MIEVTEQTQGNTANLRPWAPGQSGNPKGRPKGARTKFSDAFFRDLAEDWQEHGAEAIAATREKEPGTYLRVCASLMSKEVDVRTERYADMSDDELRAAFARTVADLSRLGLANGRGTEGEGSTEPPVPILSLQ